MSGILLESGNLKPQGQEAVIKDTTGQAFVQDVLEASLQVPVIVDFWAPWCGPCKQLTPILEKTVKAAKGAVRLVKVNIDENKDIAAQLRIQSVPTVYAFVGGRPVDGFTGALPESQVRMFVERLSGSKMGSGEEILKEAKAALESGDTAKAKALYAQVLAEEESEAAVAGLGRCLLAEGALEEVKELLEGLEPSWQNHAEIQGLKTALALAAEHKPGNTAELEKAVQKDPADHQARLDLATALFAAGKQEEAFDHLLESIRRDRSWNEEAARKKLLQFFEALGHGHPASMRGRRKLSAILFS